MKLLFPFLLLSFCLLFSVNVFAVGTISDYVLSAGGSTESSSTSYIVMDVVCPDTTVIGEKSAGNYCIIDGIYGYTQGVVTKFLTWYFAEGATLGTFDEWILIQNPNSSTANVTVAFMKNDGGTEVRSVTVPGTSRYTLHVNNIVSNDSVSTKLESTNGVSIIAERAMYWDVDGYEWIGGHDSIGVTQPATTWYLAEGSTAGSFTEWLLIQNPNSSTANVMVTFMKSDGTTEIQNISVSGISRYTIRVNDVVPNESVSTKVESTNGVGIIAERAMYWDAGILEWPGGHCSIGATTDSTTWYLAEGNTADSFDEWVLIQNPNSNTANVTVTFMKSNGETVVRNINVSGTSRHTINVNQIVPDESVSTMVESTNGVGIVVERSMYWDAGGMEWVGGHCTTGATADSTKWYLAEGCTAGGFGEWILIQNPNSSTANVTVTFMKSDGETMVRNINVSGTSRYTINVNQIVPDEAVSTMVESTNGVGIVVERSMYWDADGVKWAGGHCSRGVAY